MITSFLFNTPELPCHNIIFDKAHGAGISKDICAKFSSVLWRAFRHSDYPFVIQIFSQNVKFLFVFFRFFSCFFVSFRVFSFLFVFWYFIQFQKYFPKCVVSFRVFLCFFVSFRVFSFLFVFFRFFSCFDILFSFKNISQNVWFLFVRFRFFFVFFRFFSLIHVWHS